MSASIEIERLAKQLWGEAAWISGPYLFRGDDPDLQGTWCASAHASPPGDPPVSISVNYLPTRAEVLATLCAALSAALGAAAGAAQVSMATCGAEGVDAEGREVSHGRS